MKYLLSLLGCLLMIEVSAQDFGNLPTIPRQDLLNDLELLYQGLDQFHSGMYWYTPKDSVDAAFQEVRNQLTRDMNVMEFYRLMAPLVGLSREDHADISLSSETIEMVGKEAAYFPYTVVFLGKRLFLVRDGSDEGLGLTGQEVKSINGFTPVELVEKIGNLFASDGYIKAVKYSDLEGFSFARYHYYYYGKAGQFEIQLKGDPKVYVVKALKRDVISQNLSARSKKRNAEVSKESLEFNLIGDSIAYLGIHSFGNGDIRENKINDNYQKFLGDAFATIASRGIKTLIIDVGENGGGTEGNENLLYSYLAPNYRKYLKVRAKAQKVVLDNGTDQPVKLKTFGFLEKTFFNRKMPDGSYERKHNAGHGLMAFKKTPANRFDGKLYVIISPVTYSGGSEFSNMVYTNKRGVFVGQETGGGFYGNTSGYGRDLTLPHSKITVELPALQFMMNVEGLPFGRGVIPHHKVIPTFDQYVKGENAALEFILQLEKRE